MSKELEEIDSEILIGLVQDKPEIWDKAVEDYKNRNKKSDAWRSICAQLKDNFENLSDGERKEFGQLVLKRWNNIRDQWLKWRNRDKKCKTSGAGASKLPKYLYHEQLHFLEKGLYRRPTHSSIDTLADNEHTDEAESEQQTQERQSAANQVTATPDETEEILQTPSAKIPLVKTTSVQQSTRKRKRGLDEFELRMLKAVEAGDQEDRHMQFFRGILPSVQKFTDNQIVDFQMGVLQVIKNMQNIASIPTTIYAPPNSVQYTQQYPCTFPSQNSQPYPLTDFSYTPLLPRTSKQHHQPIPSSSISISCPSHLTSPAFPSPASEDTQCTDYSDNVLSPLTQSLDIDF